MYLLLSLVASYFLLKYFLILILNFLVLQSMVYLNPLCKNLQHYLHLNYPCQYSGNVVRLSALAMRKRQIYDVYNLLSLDAQRRGWATAIRARVGQFLKLNG